MDAQRYLDDIKTRITTSALVIAAEIIAERVSENCGYFRARLTLANSDFLEVSEYFAVEAGTCSAVEYRYHWMDHSQQRLIKRWDNAEHFPNLPDFPHHMHVGSEEQVVPGAALSIIELIDWLEQELGGKS